MAFSALGPVMLDLQGPTLEPEEAERLKHPATGGVILFRRNFIDPDQLSELVRDIRQHRPGLLIAVDHEGGRVQRFREGFTPLPAAAQYARFQKPEYCEQAGWLMAAELRAVGIDFSFAPVLDVEQGLSTVIGDRAFGHTPEEVALYAGAFLKGMHRAGMAGVGKHFPGHGGVIEDSHFALPVDHRRFDEMASWDLEPFRTLIPAGLEGIMPAHVIYDQLDAAPAGFSSFWIRQVLRQDLDFKGAVFSDDLSMAGARLAGTAPERAERALDAGCDMVLVCNEPESAAQVLDHLGTPNACPLREQRLGRFRGQLLHDRNELRQNPEIQALKKTLEILSGEPE